LFSSIQFFHLSGKMCLVTNMAYLFTSLYNFQVLILCPPKLLLSCFLFHNFFEKCTIS